MKSRTKLILLIFTFIILTFIIYQNRYNIEFKYHVFGFEKKLFDGDFLHPRYVYLKNNKVIGLEMTANPECGQTSRKYFFDPNENLNKVIYQIDFFSSHCEENDDFLYVIKRKKINIAVYEKNGNEILNENELKKILTTFKMSDLKKEMQTWTK